MNATLAEKINKSLEQAIFKSLILPPPVFLAVSYDMRWQKRAGERVYDSLSGHGYIIGWRSKKVIFFGILKKCPTCIAHNNNEEQIPAHKCNVNHTGSSESMKTKLAFHMVSELCLQCDNRTFFSEIVTDDDTTMRANSTQFENKV